LNVVPENATELIVRKGRVILSDSHTKVKGGNKVVFNATNVSVAKLTKEEKKASESEEVDNWSKDRVKMLAKANRRINDRMLDSAFATFADLDPFSRSYDRFSRRFGLWFYYANLRCYTFLPFYYGWGSPYGSSYSTTMYYPPAYTGGNGNGYTPPASGGGTSPSGGSSGHVYPSSGGSGSTPRPAAPPPAPSGDFGGGRRERIPDMETGRPMPRKNIEPSRPN
jgi:hypothetical protein